MPSGKSDKSIVVAYPLTVSEYNSVPVKLNISTIPLLTGSSKFTLSEPFAGLG